MNINRVIAVSSIIILAACASKANYTWAKGALNEQGKEFTIDDSICTAESYKAAPVMPMPSGNYSMAQGVLAGQMKKVRIKVYDGCMLGKGWEKQPIQQHSLVDSLLKK